MTTRRISTVALLFLAACSSTETPAPPPTSSTILVGEVEGGSALVAVVRDQDAIVVYTCGVAENLATHTGWFSGAPAGDTLPAMRSAGGLELSGTLAADGARGTLKLTSGEVLRWTATGAAGGAGLYQGEDAIALSGLIVANDGRTAGNAKLSSAPVTGISSVAVSVPGGAPRTRVNPVPVTFPVGKVIRTVRLPPLTTPRARVVLQKGPVVVFLVHGMSDNINTPEVGAAEDVVKCEGPRNAPFYSRCEWGVDFIPGLFDADPGAQLFNLAGADVTGLRYLDTPANRPLIDEDLGITERDADGCVTSATAEEVYDARAAAHFVTSEAPGREPPRLSVFATWRDSTRGVVESSRRVTRQAYAALRAWEERYGVTPGVVFVAQSFGGIATRFLLSNPPPETFDTPLLNADGIVVCPEDRAKMDYLRDRTIFALTLATPHEGSYMAEFGEPTKAVLRDALGDLRDGLDRTLLARVLRATDAGLVTVGAQPANLVDRAQDEIARMQNLLTGPALRDLKLDTMLAFNEGPLSPELARRTSGSPIPGARGVLVPIYATLARSPGSSSFDSPEILEGFDRYDAETEKEKGWIFSTMFLSDVLVRQVFPEGFGAVPAGAEVLDRRARLLDLSDVNTAAEQVVSDAAEGILDALSIYFAGRFGAGVDGVLEYLSSAEVAVFIPNVMVPIHVDRRWRLGLSGSIDVPMLALACGGEQIPLDHDPLLQALLVAFGRTTAVAEALEGGDPTDVIEAAGGVIEDGATLASGTLEWLTGKLAALGEVPAACRLPTDAGQLVTDFFSLGNIVNWELVGTTGPIPAPAWERTDTAASDGEIDTDGVVHASSALGFTLGRQPFFFEHDRDGSWYRLHDNPVTEKYNHGLQYQNDVGRWIRDTLLRPDVGPVPQREGFSAWTQ